MALQFWQQQSKSSHIWNPSDITGYRVALEPDTILFDGSNKIYQWSDKWGANHFIQAVGAYQPIYISDGGVDINNLPVAYFNGSNYLYNSSLLINKPATIFIIYRITASDFYIFFDGLAVNHRMCGYYYPNSIYIEGNSSVSFNYAKAAPYTYVAHTFIFNDAGKFYENGILKKSGALTLDKVDGLKLGTSYVNTALMNGYIAGFYVFDGELGTTDMGLMDTYIQNKYL
jgi:hypothetical protein